MNDLIAHISDDGSGREESVAEHTEKTVYLCKEKGRRCGISQIMSLCGIFHDMGKCKQKFFDYIHAEERDRKKLRGKIAHASTGAKYFYNGYLENSGLLKEKVLVEMISYAIAAHHGLFDCINEERKDIFSVKLDNVEDYDEACANSEIEYLGRYPLEKIFADAEAEFDVLWNNMKKVIPSIERSLGDHPNKKALLGNCRGFLFSSLQRLLLSILIDSDWEATSDFMNGVNTLSKRRETDSRDIFQNAGKNFEAYMQKLHHSIQFSELTERERNIRKGRDQLHEECREFAKHPAGIYCLPIPTGGGKTLSSLAYALEYCKCHPETERIIYVSPYISITEQNARVFREATGQTEWILEHHSSVVKDFDQEEEDYRRSGVERQDISWEEPFICTTFVQFMNTLFSNQSASVRRMHRLVNSVIIIDEVQSMPMKCVHTFNQMINFVNAVCNADIILCTATQPALSETNYPVCYSEPKYMIKNVEPWFRRFERVRIELPEVGRKHTYESLGREIFQQTDRFQSILVILNTKSAVGKLYDILKELPIYVEYLTTNLCAEHRSDKIASIKKQLKTGREKVVVVSTNLIEAGVDISFECVYRSMTGLDSLAQSAGRCNRNGEKESGILQLIDLEGENTGSMEEHLQHVRVTENILYQYRKESSEESLLMPQWMDRYYKKIYMDAADTMNFPIKQMDTSIMELLARGFSDSERGRDRTDKLKNHRSMNQAYKTAGKAYRVIDDHSFGVIVPYKKGADMIAAMAQSSDGRELRSYIRQAQRYTVNVRESLLKKYSGLIQRVSEEIPDIYMIAAPGAYSEERGITAEWEPLIF